MRPGFHPITIMSAGLCALALALSANSFASDNAVSRPEQQSAKRIFLNSRKTVVKAAAMVLSKEGADRTSLRRALQHLKAAIRMFKADHLGRSAAHSLEARRIAREIIEKNGGAPTGDDGATPEEEEMAEDVPSGTLSNEAAQEEITDKEESSAGTETGIAKVLSE